MPGSSVVGALRVNLGVDSAQFSSGLRQANVQLNGFGREAQRSVGNVVALRTGVQNTAFQLQDFAVQVSGGTGAMRALSQQLPQMLGSFGVMGAVIGGVVAALPLLILGFSKIGSTSLDLTDQVKGLGEALTALKDVNIEVASATDLFGNAMKRLAVSQAQTQINALKQTLDALIADVTIQIDPENVFATQVISGVGRLREALELTQPQAQQLYDALTALTRAPLEQMAGKAQDALNVIANITAESRGQLTPAMQGVVDAITRAAQMANSLSGNTDGATAAAGKLQAAWMGVLAAAQSTMMASARAEGALARAQQARQDFMSTQPTKGGFGRPEDFPIGGTLSAGAGADIAFPTFGKTIVGAPKTGGGGGGGGGSGVDLAKKQLEEMARVEGAVQDAVDRASENIRHQNERTADSFANLFGDVITGARSLQDVLASLAEDLGKMFLSQGFQALLNGPTGTGGGNWLGTLLGFAGGTQFAPGGLAMVGERGPELVHLPRGAKVTPNAKLGGSNVYTFAPVYNAPGADAQKLEQLRAENRAMFDQFRSNFRGNAVAAVSDRRNRGRI